MRSFSQIHLIDADLVGLYQHFLVVAGFFPEPTSFSERMLKICKDNEGYAIDKNGFGVLCTSSTVGKRRVSLLSLLKTSHCAVTYHCVFRAGSQKDSPQDCGHRW